MPETDCDILYPVPSLSYRKAENRAVLSRGLRHLAATVWRSLSADRRSEGLTPDPPRGQDRQGRRHREKQAAEALEEADVCLDAVQVERVLQGQGEE